MINKLVSTTINPKGLTLVPKAKQHDYRPGADLLFSDGRFIYSMLDDRRWVNITAWFGVVLAFSISGTFGLWGVLFHNGDIEILYLAVPMLAISIPMHIWIHKLNKQGPQDGEILFNRKTGMVSFTEYYGTKAFEIPFEYLDLYIVQLSAGKGVMFYKAYYIPQKLPEGVGKHRMYEAPLDIKSPEDAQWIWGAYCQFMDPKQPIPKHFYRWMQLAVNENQGVLEDMSVDQEITEQAPFYDEKLKQVIDKEVW